jgi:hypothetical protein
MPYKVPILNIPRSIREDVSGQYDCTSDSYSKNDDNEHTVDDDDDDDDDDNNNNNSNDRDDGDDLIFGDLDDENSSKHMLEKRSSSTDEGIHLHSDIYRTKKRERANSSISTGDDDWENILPITEADGPLLYSHYLQSSHEKSSIEPIVGMSNFRLVQRSRRRSKSITLARWKDAVKKVVQLKDPW